MERWRKLMEQRGTRTDMPMKPQVRGLGTGKAAIGNGDCLRRFRHEYHLVGATNSCEARANVFAVGKSCHHGSGLPYTIAAQIAYPERQCVAFVGDGGFSMLMAEFATA